MAELSSILVIDDDPDFYRIVNVMLEGHGLATQHALSQTDALEQIRRRQPEAIVLDRQLGSTDGIELLPDLARQCPEVPIVLVTAFSEVEVVVDAIKRGAFDFLPKPVNEARLVATVTKAVEHGRLLRRVRSLEHGDAGQPSFDEMVGASPPMLTIFRIIQNVAPTDVSVMIVGESGTGKELIAKAIHGRSQRSGGPFVALNMGALPKDLIESTLFGHEKGAFTGADKRRLGACEEAAGGTLFLDEVSEMPIDTQPKLLRFLQERVFRRVGGTSDLGADVRIVSATNRDPLQAVRDNRLREDLYYRLNVVPVVVPPLRQRLEDIGLLATHALRRCSTSHGKSFRQIDELALKRLQSCQWPGNVRQLMHVIERIVIMNEGTTVTASMLPDDLEADVLIGVTEAAGDAARSAPQPAVAAEPARPETTSHLPLAEIERLAILEAVESHGSAAKAARALGISEATIYRRLREYGAKT
jgi:DNA-binding NtrC family response regulator